MKIGMFSDVHADFDLLNQTLDLFQQDKVDLIVCAGDLVDRGPDGDAVVQRISQAGIPCVQGNHDALALRTQQFLSRNRDAPLPIQPLTAETVDFLSNLVLELRFEWEGAQVYMTHANPWHDMTERIYPNAPHAIFETIVEQAGADIVILGHSHRPMHIQLKAGRIINPGSIHANYGGYEPTCAILHLPEQAVHFWDVNTGAPVYVALVEV